MNIKKIDEEITYRRTESTITFDINGKKIRLYVHEDYDEMSGSDYDWDESDLELLTDEEKEELDEESVWDLVRDEE